jgi:hypothetical protein
MVGFIPVNPSVKKINHERRHENNICKYKSLGFASICFQPNKEKK